MATTFLALLLTQVDKILLSRLSTLEAFSYYALAGRVANGLYMLSGPITAAFYPRFTELAIRDDQSALRALYHQGAQLITVLMGAAAMVVIAFGDRILLLWTADPALVQQVAPLLTVLALGTLLNGLMWIPYQMQLAHGWTTLSIKANIVAVGVLVPTILLIVPEYGAIGAAWVWVTLNAGYLLFTIPLMHRRLLPTDKWRWYRQDVAVPLGAAAATASLCRWVIPDELAKIGELTVLVIGSGCVLIAAALVAPMVRGQLVRHVPSRIKLIYSRMIS